MRRFIITALAASAVLAPVSAIAHPKLVAASPAANAVVVKPKSIKLSFSEALVGPLSGIELTMTGMPGMAAHAPMPIKGFKTVANGKDLMISLPRALPAGTYELKYHVVAADQHRIESSYTFTVR